MSNDISRDEPGDALRRRFQAQARMGKGTCGHVADKSNLQSFKDGRVLCPDCFAKFLDDLFGEETR